MASEKDHFRAALGYIKYDQFKADSEEKKNFYNKELSYWQNRWPYSENEIKYAPLGLNIKTDFLKEFNSSDYERGQEASEILENSFDDLINKKRTLLQDKISSNNFF